MSIFMKFGDLQGECADAAHHGWMDVTSIHWAVERRITSATSTRGDRESANAEITDLEITRRMDSASPALFMEACCGRGRDVVIHMTKTGDGTSADVYNEYVLKNAVLGKYQVDAVAQDTRRPIETLRISFIDMEVRYVPYDDKGKAQAAIAVGYDTSSNTKR